MRHRCEACQQLVSLAGHTCDATTAVIAAKRGLQSFGNVIVQVGSALAESAAKMAEEAGGIEILRRLNPARLRHASELARTTPMTLQEAWDSLEGTRFPNGCRPHSPCSLCRHGVAHKAEECTDANFDLPPGKRSA